MSPVLFCTTSTTWEFHEEAIVTRKHKFLWLSCRASLVAQLVKNLPTMWETWISFLGWEDPMEKGKATHSSILVWRIHGMHSPWGPTEMGRKDPLSLSFQTQINSMFLMIVAMKLKDAYSLKGKL